MKTQIKCLNKTPISALAAHADHTFGVGMLRVFFRRTAVLGASLATVLLMGSASAEWLVQDRQARQRLASINDRIGGGDTVNKNLDDLRLQQRVQGEVYNPTASEETKSKLAEAPAHQTKEAAQQARCAGKKVSPEQRNICNAIVELEFKRYQYLQDMRALSLRREQELSRIYEERKAIGEWEMGRLQSNTNRLLALIAHQRIDQLNLEMALATFDERLRLRKQEQNSVAQGMMDPQKKNLTEQVIGGAAQVAVLKGALAVASQRKR